MNLSISPEIVEKYPSYRLILITVPGVQVSEHDGDVDSLLIQQEEYIHRTIETASLLLHPHISSWRKTYASFGAKPSQYHCAVESLIRAILKRGHLPRINSLVDLCNCVSVEHVLPIDIMDLGNLEGDISVRFARGDERFLALGSCQSEPPHPGEVIYSDAVDVLGRRWNWRKSEKSKVTVETKNALITIEGIEDISTEALKAAEAKLCGLLERFCDGTLSTHFLDIETPQVCIWQSLRNVRSSHSV